MSDLRNRHEEPDADWLLPVTPPEGVGIVTPGCRDRSDPLAIPVRVGVGLRIGGEADLCFRCGPDGSVYHPAERSIAVLSGTVAGTLARVDVACELRTVAPGLAAIAAGERVPVNVETWQIIAGELPEEVKDTRA